MRKTKSTRTAIPSTSTKEPDKNGLSALIAASMLFVLSFVLYYPSTDYDFTVDDFPAIRNNQQVQQGISAIPDLFGHSLYYGYDKREKAREYRPLASSMFAGEVSLFGNDPAKFHLVNVVLYFLFCALLFYFLTGLSGNIWISFSAVLLFTVHPLHTEVVANVKSGDDLLLGILMVLSWSMYVTYLRQKNTLTLIASLVFYLFALFTKELAVPLILIFPLLHFCVRTEDRDDYKISFWFLLPCILYLVVRLAVIQSPDEIDVTNNALLYEDSWWKQKATGLLLLLKYFTKFFYPLPLTWSYDLKVITLTDFADYRVWIGLLLHLVLLATGIILLKKQGIIAFGILLYLIGIALFSQLFILIDATFAERFMFIPSAGLSIALVFGLAYFVKKENMTVALVAVMAVPFFVISVNRLPDWKNNKTLFSADIDKIPNSHRGNAALAFALYTEYIESPNPDPELLQQSLEHFTRAINVYGGAANTWYNYGMANIAAGEYTMAELSFIETVKINPLHTSAYNNLGNIEFLKKEYENAKIYYLASLSADSTNMESLGNLGAVYLQLEKNDSAIFALQQVLEFNPNNENARKNYEIAVKRLQRGG